MAPDGQIWVCGACGKTSKDRYGDPGKNWDEACMLNSVLCHVEPERIEGEPFKWRAVEEAT